MIRRGIGVQSFVSAGGGTDADAQAFITAAGITDATQQLAINTLVTDLKTYGIWTKMKAIYPFVGGTSSTHKWNLKDPRDLDAAFRLVFSGGWTHSSNGATPNGTNAYADTFLTPSISLSLSSGHFSSYLRTNTQGGYDVGSISTGTENLLIARWTDDKFYVNYGQTTYPNATNTDSRGLFVTNRNSTTNTTGYKNGSKLIDVAQTSILSTNKLFIAATNQNGSPVNYSSRQTAFASIGDGLTDTEAANLYTSVQKYQTTLGRSVGTQTVSDSDAQAFVNAAVIEDQVQATAINTLVTDLKGYGIWSKMKAIYPFVGGTSSAHKWNLKDPRDLDAAFRLVFSGGWTHSSGGATPNGTNGYADTKLNCLNNLSQNSTHFSFYSRTNSNGTEVELGARQSTTTGRSNLLEIRTSGITYVQVSQNGTSNLLTFNDTNSAAFYIGNRTASNLQNAWKNSNKLATDTTTSSATQPNFNIFLSAFNEAATPLYFSTKQCAFASIGDGLTDTEAANLYTAVQAYQTSLSRNV